MSSVSDRPKDLIHAPGVPPLVFVFAFAAGAWHAVAPGHGKTLAAAYLAGSRGRVTPIAAAAGVTLFGAGLVTVGAIHLAAVT